MTSVTTLATDLPQWPTESGPYVALVDASSSLEAELLHDYLDEIEATANGPMSRFNLPPSRRRRRYTHVDPSIQERLLREDDPLCVPLRVVWLPRERDGVRRVELRDMLIPGDPRDPNLLQQQYIKVRHPDRVRIVVGKPARRSDLERRWNEPTGRTLAEGTTLGEFVALQAWLALERAERHLRGLRYKVPKFLTEDLFWSRPFQAGIERLATQSGKTESSIRQRTSRYLREIAAQHSPNVIDLVNAITSTMIRTAHRRVDYDPTELHKIYARAEQTPLVFLPSHKSNFDHLVFQHVLYENELPLNHTAGGINMNFFLIGPLLRRAGIFFIRREFKDNEPYKFVLRQYLDYLLEKRFALEWYVEGGRSRSGKLREPRLGLLAYVADSYQRGIADDVVLVPVSIAYDQITDVSAYTAEQRGQKKEKESFLWAIKFIASLRRKNGNIYIRFGEPLAMSEQIPRTLDLDAPEGRLALPKLAFEVSTRINDVTPITPVSLVTMALLSKPHHGFSADETLDVLEPFLQFVQERNLPVAGDITLDDAEAAMATLEQLASNGVLHRTDGLTKRIYSVNQDQHLAAAYYRNTVIHFFVPMAIAEIALALGFEDDAMLESQVIDRAVELRDLLKFEFFFSPTEQFREEIATEIARYRIGPSGPDDPVIVDLRAMWPAKSPIVLRPFLEAYLVVAETLVFHGDQPLTTDSLPSEALRMGEEMYHRGTIRSMEALSTALFASGISLAQNRGLLDGEPDGRIEFRDELGAILDALNAITESD